MTKNYEKLLSSVQMCDGLTSAPHTPTNSLSRLSELLSLPMPSLPTASQKSDSILIGGAGSSVLGGDGSEEITSAGKWEDEEERRFYEDVQDLKDFVPKSVLGIEGKEGEEQANEEQEDEEERQAREKEEVKKLEEELQRLEVDGAPARMDDESKEEEADDEFSFLVQRHTRIVSSHLTMRVSRASRVATLATRAVRAKIRPPISFLIVLKNK